MRDPLRRFRKYHGIESTDDIWQAQLDKDIKKFEAYSWVEHLIQTLALSAYASPELSEEQVLPKNTLEIWAQLDAETQAYVFLYLLGGLYGLLRPPDDAVGALI